MMSYTHILFDLDGTLTDPKVGITKAVQYALSQFNIIENDLDKLEPFIGPPLAKSFAEYYSFSEQDAWTAVEHYRVYYRERGMYENEVYNGITELLALLQSQGKVLIVATSKPTLFSKQILEHFDLDQYFTYIHGSEMDGTRSDKSELIAHILETYNLAKEQAIMIGDRKHDMIGARNNNIDTIGVGYGYGSELELRTENPTYYYRTVEELIKAFT
ncbi:HAD family hydrolase [Paenibacillus caui]|uniref:HAD family hydrolase n=1 Tax=Paenibacillus caui TaxID=2873927 RepID=UPI001F3938FC|nr:HAD family hydrolase [Paenibacillus caui]